MYSLHDSGAVIFRYCQIRDTCKQARKQLQTLIVTCRKSLKELIYSNLRGTCRTVTC